MKHLAPTTALAALLIASAAAGAKPPLAVATVNGKAITKRQLVARMTQRMPFLSFHRRFTREMMKKLKKASLEHLIKEELLFQEARRQRLLPTDAAVKQAKARQIKAARGKRQFGKRLRGWHMSWADHWRALKRRLAVNALLKKRVIAPSRVTDKEARAHYDSDPKRFKRPPEVKLRQMLFKVKPGSPEKAYKTAQARARAIIVKLKAGADFAKLARSAIRTKGSHTRGGELGWIHQGRLIPQLEKIAFSLKKGEVSAPIRTLEGYVILRVDDRRPATQLSYKDAGPKLRQRMFKRRATKRKAALIKRQRDKATIVRVKPAKHKPS